MTTLRKTARRWGWAALTVAALPVSGQTLTQDEALALAFGDAEISRQTAYLDEAQLERARETAGAGVAVESGVITYYVAERDGRPIGVAYFDSHRVRTLPEVLMIVISPEGTVARVETVAFREPPEYRAPDRWLELAAERRVANSRAAGELPNLGGATLTANAVKQALSRTLALHAVIAPTAPIGQVAGAVARAGGGDGASGGDGAGGGVGTGTDHGAGHVAGGGHPDP